MQTLRLETTVPNNREIKIDLSPFLVGESVEVIVLSLTPEKNAFKDFPLKNMVLKYDNPTAPIAENDWDALK